MTAQTAQTAQTTQTAPTPNPTIGRGERADLLSALEKHRHFLCLTMRDLTDEQAAGRTTASELCLGGLVKHVTEVESGWVDFIIGEPDAMPASDDWDSDVAVEAWQDRFRMTPGEDLAGLLGRYAQVARRTDEVVATADLDASHPLPTAPWFEQGARWTTRRVVQHLIAETAQHAGHADIIRESLDGAKTMG